MKHNIIKKHSNFESDATCVFLTNFIKGIIKEERKGLLTMEGSRPTFMFGDDNCHGEQSRTDFSSVKEIKTLLSRISSAAISEIKREFKDQNNLFLSSIFLASQNPGDEVSIHEDTDDGQNEHYIYSSVLYLNNLKVGGELIFPDLQYSIKPRRGDLVFFNTRDGGRHEVLEVPEYRYSICMWFCYDKSFNLKIQ